MRIAILGPFCGWIERELNPGAFLLGYNHLHEIKTRLPDAKIDLLSTDFIRPSFQDLDFPDSEVVDGICIHYITDKELFDKIYNSYDVLIVGSDNIVRDHPDSLTYFNLLRKLHRYNFPFILSCISAKGTANSLVKHSDLFRVGLCNASYASVRIRGLQRFICDEYNYHVPITPDPVLGSPFKLISSKFSPELIEKKNLPIIGIALKKWNWRYFFTFAQRNRALLEQYHLYFYNYSSVHHCDFTHNIISRYMAKLDLTCTFDFRPLSPLQCLSINKYFHISFNSTYHGTVCGIVSGTPVIPGYERDRDWSRRLHAYSDFGLSGRFIDYSFHKKGNFSEQMYEFEDKLPMLLKNPAVADKKMKETSLNLLQKHYDDIILALNR